MSSLNSRNHNHINVKRNSSSEFINVGIFLLSIHNLHDMFWFFPIRDM